MNKTGPALSILVLAYLASSCVTFEAVKNGHLCSPSPYKKQVDEMLRIMECGEELLLISVDEHGGRDYAGTLQDLYEDTCSGEGKKSSFLWKRCPEMQSILHEYKQGL